MKTEYLIAIIDDNESGLKSAMGEIQRFLKKEAILLNYQIIIVNNDWKAEADENFNKLMNEPELDMVLVDFNLDDSFKGDAVIEYIRESGVNYHVPIVFYTSQNVDNLVNRSNQNRVKSGKQVFEGIYYTDRDFLEGKVTSILESLIKKENTIQRGRGLLLDSCSEIEAKISQIFSLLKIKLVNKKAAAKIIFKHLKRGASDSFKKKLHKENDVSIFNFINSSDCRTHTHKKVASLYEILSMPELSSLITAGKVSVFGRLYSDIVSKSPSKQGLMDFRNIYSHCSKVDIIPIHNPKYIRQECIAQLQNLDSIIDLLNS